jgi:HlyD family secretion protein
MTIKPFPEINRIAMKNTKTSLLLLFFFGIISCKEKTNLYDASGSFEATETIIAAEANGQILRLNIEEGQPLDSGQLIGFIDSTQLHLTKLQLVQSRKAILSGRPQANVQVEALRNELANAVLDRDRTARLVAAGVASQKQLDDADAKIATLKSRVAAQESSLQTTTSSITEQGSTVEAQMREINDQLKKSVIVNPVKGTVLTKYAEQFEMAALGKPLYKIADLSTIILRAYITGDQLHLIKVGEKVKVFTDDGKGGYKETEGLITWISAESEFTPKTIQTKNERANLVYAIKVSVRNDGYLKLGMYGEIKWNNH